MKKFLFALSLSALFTSVCGNAGATNEIKLAILAPEGSAWHQVMTDWDKELRQKTGNSVGFKIYPGGVQGDEDDVIRKMRINQLHAAGLTGRGLGVLNPEIRVLELPTLVMTYGEADAVTKRLQPKLEAGFNKKGFVLLGWAETGFVNIFSAKKPIASRKDMDGAKMWAWKGDPLVETMYKTFNIVPIPLPITDVLSSLQTNLIDAVYAPPLGAIALQWFTQTKYMTDMKLADSTGGIVMTQNALNSLSSSERAALLETAKKYSRQIVERTRSDNEKSYETLRQAGVESVSVPPSEIEYIKTTSKKVWTDLVGKLYSKELLDEAISAVDEYRSKNEKEGAH